MNEVYCAYSGNRDETLIAYLYDEIDGSDRMAFDTHLADCAVCRGELVVLRNTRERLGQWSVAEIASLVAPPAAAPAARWWQQVPAWAQVAAAMVFVGVGAGVANLDVKYDQNGLSVRTGWSSPAPAAAVDPASATPWRAELASLEQQLRAELRATSSKVAAIEQSTPDANQAQLIRQVKALIEEAERREQRELALRVAEVTRDVQAQRQADLAKVERSIVGVQNNVGFEIMRQRADMNSLAVRVSSQGR
jgi:hypothetical protein